MKRNPHDEVYWSEEQQKAHLSGVRSNDLLGCPFCGGPAYIHESKAIEGMIVFYPRCRQMECCGNNGWIDFETREKAIEAWNRRAT
jgi:Lar family restriction alleviation protein